MLQAGVLPLAVRLEHRGVGDVQLLGEVVGHLRRHVGRIVQEHPQIPDRAQLHREAEPVVRPPLPLDQLPVRIVQEEETLQLSAGRRPAIRRVPRGLLIRQKLDRHPGPPDSRSTRLPKVQPSQNPRSKPSRPSRGLSAGFRSDVPQPPGSGAAALRQARASITDTLIGGAPACRGGSGLEQDRNARVIIVGHAFVQTSGGDTTAGH